MVPTPLILFGKNTPCSSLELGALAYMAAKLAEYFPISEKIYYIGARVLRQRKLNEYTIIYKKVGDGHRS
jgi:hypothetical protein